MAIESDVNVIYDGRRWGDASATTLDRWPRKARLFELEPGLAERLEPITRARLRETLRVPVINIEAGQRLAAVPDPDGLGLLVVDAVLLRDMAIKDRSAAELLGPGDVLRPWLDSNAPESSVPAASRMQAVQGGRLAVVDGSASAVMGRHPELVAELLDRTLLRARMLQFQLALAQVSGIATRVHLLLWQLADRWGYVRPDGVVLPFAITHGMIARLVGARRQSVCTAMGDLARRGLVLRVPTGWVLHGQPPCDATAPHVRASAGRRASSS